MTGLLMHFMPLIIAMVAGTIAVVLHNSFAKGEGWYANANHAVQAAIGMVVTMVLAYAATKLPILQPAADACAAGASNVLTQDCLNAIGGLFNKENVSMVLGLLVTLFGHATAAVKQVHANQIALAAKSGVALPHPR